MAKEEDISGNALIVFETFKQLMSLPYIEQTIIDEERYTVLYQNMVMNQIPYFIKSKRTLSRAIKELKDAELIKSNDNNKYPAYIFTDKALQYITSFSKNEISDTAQQTTKKRKKPILTLPKKVRFENLKNEYLNVLKARAEDMSKKHSVPFSEFNIFIEYHVKNGNSFANWLSAYSTWCRNYKKFHTNDGENSTRGLYG
jgi:hypothetical protein